jgi:hypothetical protein
LASASVSISPIGGCLLFTPTLQHSFGAHDATGAHHFRSVVHQASRRSGAVNGLSDRRLWGEVLLGAGDLVRSGLRDDATEQKENLADHGTPDGMPRDSPSHFGFDHTAATRIFTSAELRLQIRARS